MYSNLQATKLFGDIGYQRGMVTNSLSLKISYRAIGLQRLNQHCVLSKIVYLYVKYMIATRNYAMYNTGIGAHLTFGLPRGVVHTP